MSQEVQFKQQMEALAKQGADVDTDAEHDPATSRRASNAGLNREAAVQRKAGGKPAGDVQGIAAQGVQGAGGPLPHMDRIQASFGSHDVSGVQAHTGGEAAQASQAMGASAYATGNSVAFAGQPDLHTAAHEAAHVVQQRAGVQLKGGVGAAGDEHEQQADQVADRVVAGKPAGDLLGAPKASAAPAQGGPVQMKPEPTPQEKAHEKSDIAGEQSVVASLKLFAKHLHEVKAAFDSGLSKPNAGGPDFDLIVGHYNAVEKEARHVESAVGISELDKYGRARLDHEVAMVKGAWEALRPSLQAGIEWAAKPAGQGGGDTSANRNTEFINSYVRNIVEKTGNPYENFSSNANVPDGTEQALHIDAITQHLEAVRGAVDSVTAGNVGDAKRIVTHVNEVTQLSAGQKAPMKSHTAELKKLATDVKAIEKSHPDLAATLGTADTQIEALKKLIK